ncbi:ANL_collapsed_G0053280.mRNA.1.CDS.1 [Saccharomyces cerevisiae]|nr:ANL_collapsed_G0053280.mRNA.1.CDS.1 [Saccharomyces cerevisiae]
MEHIPVTPFLLNQLKTKFYWDYSKRTIRIGPVSDYFTCGRQPPEKDLLPLEDFYVNCSTDSLVPVDLWQACVDPQSPVNVSVTDKLLTKTFNQLLANLMNAEERTSDSTLATIMMLAAFDIFFSDKRRKWRAHVYGAGRLIMERLCDSGSNMLTISDEGESNDLFLLPDGFQRERDEIFKAYYSQGRPEIHKGYRILRATNLIFGLTGSFQLKRRVLNLPQNSRIIEDSLVKITKLVDESIPLVSSSTSCIIFCLFCCGCELLSDSMVKYRPVYMKRIDSLNRKGVSSAAMAKRIMEKCWNEKKFWWDILRENNLDITFAI